VNDSEAVVEGVVENEEECVSDFDIVRVRENVFVKEVEKDGDMDGEVEYESLEDLDSVAVGETLLERDDV
jgi:hypothetical protein